MKTRPPIAALLALTLPILAMAGAPSAMAQRLTARGVIAPRIEATLSAQIGARIARLPVDRGQSVKAGDVLVEFDCALEQARLKAAQADLDGVRARLTNAQRLDHMGSVGKLEVRIAEAEADKAAAVVEERKAVLRFCTVTAPFSGVTVDVPVHANESVEAGKPLVSLLDHRSLRIVLLAPSGWTSWLKPGVSLAFTVDETGEGFSAVVTHLDGRIDPSSQTVTVFAKPQRADDGPPLISGMTGSARFEAGPPPSSATP